MTQPDSIQWWKSSNLRWALLAIVSGVITLLRAFEVCPKFPFDVCHVGAEKITDAILAIPPIVTGIIWFVKRIRRGKDPQDPAPAIQTPGAVKSVASTVSRLTR